MGLAGVECRGWWGVEVSMEVSQEHRSVRWSQVGVLLFEEGEMKLNLQKNWFNLFARCTSPTVSPTPFFWKPMISFSPLHRSWPCVLVISPSTFFLQISLLSTSLFFNSFCTGLSPGRSPNLKALYFSLSRAFKLLVTLGLLFG